ncbi:MAG: TRAP transporter substrate-binding protein [Desulfobacterales bacterium]|nr:TRAP transporter substrate-binding protein [Desulfobacterales bacterium]MDX2511077.1 TRAP transporter substrate-binding protein [Desulfobacterales bacterium]
MKKKPVLSVIFFAIMVLIATSTTGAYAETINLRVASWMPEKSADSEVADRWTKMISEKTDGRVQFTLYKGSALGFFKDHYNMAVKGVADISLFSFGLNPGRFPISEGLHLPFVIPSSEVGGKVFNQLYKEYPELRAELSETIVLGLGTTDVWNVQSLKKPIQTLENFKGLKIRTASGAASESVKALGGIPIGMPVPELYISLQKGVVDGCVMSWEGVKSFKIYELLTQYTDVGGFSVLTQGLFMNKAALNKLPADIQKIMVEESMRWWAEEKGKLVSDKWSAEGIEAIKKEGGNIYKLPPEEKARWVAALKPVRDAWVKSVSVNGFDGEKFLERAAELVKEYQ